MLIKVISRLLDYEQSATVCGTQCEGVNRMGAYAAVYASASSPEVNDIDGDGLVTGRHLDEVQCHCGVEWSEADCWHAPCITNPDREDDSLR